MSEKRVTPSNFTVKVRHKGELIETRKIKGKVDLSKFLRSLGVPQGSISGYYAHVVKLPGGIEVEWDYL